MKIKLVQYDTHTELKPSDTFVVREVTDLYIIVEKIAFSAGIEIDQDMLRQLQEGEDVRKDN